MKDSDIEVRGLLKLLFGSSPFFGGRTHGVQSPVGAMLVLTALVSLVPRRDKPLRVLEVGAWTGFSALTWAHALRHFAGGGEVVCVDTWAPYFAEADIRDAEPIYRDMDDLARSGLAYELFCHNASCAPEGITIRGMRGNSTEILPGLEADSFDLVYLDGSHYYDAVTRDLASARNLVAPGGILAGDDLELQLPRDIDEATVRASIARDCLRDERGRWYHPGVTLAVAEAMGEVSSRGRIWFMRRTATGFAPVDIFGATAMIPPHWAAKMQDEARRMLGG